MMMMGAPAPPASSMARRSGSDINPPNSAPPSNKIYPAMDLLLPYYFDDDTLGTLPIKLAVEDTLPGTSIEFAIGNGNDDLVMEQEVFEMGITIIFARLVMVIVWIFGRQFLHPLHDIAVEAGFLVVDDDRSSDVHSHSKRETVPTPTIPAHPSSS